MGRVINLKINFCKKMRLGYSVLIFKKFKACQRLKNHLLTDFLTVLRAENLRFFGL